MAKFVAPGPGHLRRSMEDEKLDLNPKKASLNVKSKKNFEAHPKKGTRGRKVPKDLTKNAPLQIEASEKNFKTYQKKRTRGRKAPKDLTKKAPLQIEALSTEMNFMNLLEEEIMSREKTRVLPWFDKAREDHSNCCSVCAKMEDPDDPEPSDDEWKPKWVSFPVPKSPLRMDGFPTIYFDSEGCPLVW